MTMISKIADRHLSRQACIYVRQSTLAQVRSNQESTDRQYNLLNKAQSLGWKTEQIRVLDRDLGQSGAAATKRTDFKALVGDVAMGQIGAIFALEASRLARSNQDWHRLLELCAITGTLVIDEDGCYDPAEFNDSLVLGMKGTFAQAELHIIRARLHGGKLNKASRANCASRCRSASYSRATRSCSIPIGRSRARSGWSSNCSNARVPPTAPCGASRNSGCASRVVPMVARGTENSSGAG
jgi:DNA invertase Pin-like site-specific DNA recombinase